MLHQIFLRGYIFLQMKISTRDIRYPDLGHLVLKSVPSSIIFSQKRSKIGQTNESSLQLIIIIVMHSFTFFFSFFLFILSHVIRVTFFSLIMQFNSCKLFQQCNVASALFVHAITTMHFKYWRFNKKNVYFWIYKIGCWKII